MVVAVHVDGDGGRAYDKTTAGNASPLRQGQTSHGREPATSPDNPAKSGPEIRARRTLAEPRPNPGRDPAVVPIWATSTLMAG